MILRPTCGSVRFCKAFLLLLSSYTSPPFLEAPSPTIDILRPSTAKKTALRKPLPLPALLHQTPTPPSLRGLYTHYTYLKHQDSTKLPPPPNSPSSIASNLPSSTRPIAFPHPSQSPKLPLPPSSPPSPSPNHLPYQPYPGHASPPPKGKPHRAPDASSAPQPSRNV